MDPDRKSCAQIATIDSIPMSTRSNRSQAHQRSMRMCRHMICQCRRQYSRWMCSHWCHLDGKRSGEYENLWPNHKHWLNMDTRFVLYFRFRLYQCREPINDHICRLWCDKLCSVRWHNHRQHSIANLDMEWALVNRTAFVQCLCTSTSLEFLRKK